MAVTSWCPLRKLLACIVLLFWWAAGQAAAPAAGVVISNTAQATFLDTNTGDPVRLSSNTVETRVSPLEALALAANQNVLLAIGAPFVVTHTLTNTGNTASTIRLDVAAGVNSGFTPANLQVVRDANGNGRVDPGELPIPAAGIEVAAGASVHLLVTGEAPASATAGLGAQLVLTATTALQGVTASNTDTLTLTSGAAVQVLLSAGSPTATQNGNVDWTAVAVNNGNTAAAPATVTVDGAAASLFVLRAGVPANTTFASVVASSNVGARTLYHLAGQPANSFVATLPAGGVVDAVAWGIAELPPGGSLQGQFRVTVAGNASGAIATIAHADWTESGMARLSASNPVALPLPARSAQITFYTGGTYVTPALQNMPGRPLFVQADAALCNMDPTRVDTVPVTLTSQLTGDLETFTGVETSPNSGLFRIQPQVPTANAATRVVASGNGILEVLRNDLVTASIVSCAGGAASATTTLLIDPTGVVYDSRSNQPLAGATVQLVDVTGAGNGGNAGGPAAVLDFDAVTPAPSTIVTTADGVYSFPLVQPSTYRLQVTPPPGFVFPSVLPAAMQPATRVIDTSGSYGGNFQVVAGAVHFDVPLDTGGTSGLFVQKAASKATAEVGDFVDYTVTVKNVIAANLNAVQVRDALPTGFLYVKGTARLNGAATGDPAGGVGPNLTFTVGPLAAGAQAVVSYRVRIGAGSQSGTGVNTAQATGGGIVSNRASVRVRVLGGVFANEAYVIGKVYADCRRDGVQDGSEPGIPGVRIYLEDGTYAVTDEEGKYSFYGLTPRTHVAKVDSTTLPAGVRLQVLANRNAQDAGSRFVDLTNGELHKADFAVSPCDDGLREQIAARPQGPGQPVGDRAGRGHAAERRGARRGDRRAHAAVERRPGPARRGAAFRGRGGRHGRLRRRAPAGAAATDLPSGRLADGSRQDRGQRGAASGGARATAGEPAAAATDARGRLRRPRRRPGPADRADARAREGAARRRLPAAGERRAGGGHAGRQAQQPGTDRRLRLGIHRHRPAPRPQRAGSAGEGSLRQRPRQGQPGPAGAGRPGRREDRRRREARGRRHGADRGERSPARRRRPGRHLAHAGHAAGQRGLWQVEDADPRQAGTQVLVEGGQGRFLLLPPAQPGKAEITVVAGTVKQAATVEFVPALRPLIAAGLVEGTINLRKLSSAVQPAQSSDVFEREIRSASRSFDGGKGDAGAHAALFLKGKVLGSSLLTVAYDSDKASDARLFRDIQPNQFYPVYGDSSARGFEAQSSGRLFVLLQNGTNYALVGDFSTQSDNVARQLTQYNRSLNGAKGRWSGEKVSVEAFASRTSATQVVQEFRANGTSGPFQLNTNGVANSEQVHVITRSRNQPALVVKDTPLAAFTDYAVEPYTGLLILKAPVPSLDADLNPVFIRVTYDVDNGGPRHDVAGIEANVRVTPGTTVGAVVVNDNDPLNRQRLEGLTLTSRMGDKTVLTAEVARTQTDLQGRGQGERVEFKHEGNGVQARAWAVRTDSGFANPGSPQSAGQEEYGAKVGYTLDASNRIVGEALKTSNATTGAQQTGVDLRLEHTLPGNARIEVGVRHSSSNTQAALATVAAPGTSGPTVGTAAPVGAPSNQQGYTSARVKVTAPVPGVPQADVFALAEQAIDGSGREIGVGGNYAVNPTTKLYVRHDFINSLTGPYGLSAETSRYTTVAGVNTTLPDQTQVFNEYRMADAVDGRTAEAAVGVRKTVDVLSGLKVTGSLQRIKPMTGPAGEDSTAIALGAEYTQAANWKASAQVQWQSSTTSQGWLVGGALVNKLDEDWTLLHRFLYSDQENSGAAGGERLVLTAQTGFAYRPVANNKLNALGRLEYKRNRDTSLALANDENAWMVSGHVNYQPTRAWTMSGRYAARWVQDDANGLSTDSFTQLLGGRSTWDVSPRWDVGLQAYGMWGNGSREMALGLQVGYLAWKNLWLSAGYNFKGFHARELAGDAQTAKGAYVRLRFKFDEALFEGMGEGAKGGGK